MNSSIPNLPHTVTHSYPNHLRTPVANPVAKPIFTSSFSALVASWWALHTPPPRLSVTLFREALFATALEQIRSAARLGRNYDPTADHRFRWACQWLDVAEGERQSVDGHLDSIMHFLMDDATRTLTGKDLASGERAEEPQTLTLGS